MTKSVKSLSTDAWPQRQNQWGAAELCNWHRNYGKKNTKEKTGLLLNKKDKYSVRTSRQLKYVMPFLYWSPLKKINYNLLVIKNVNSRDKDLSLQ